MGSLLAQTVRAVHSALLAGAAVAATGARVELGPVVTGDPSDTIWVGFDGDPDGEMQAGSRTSEWAGLGAKKRNETNTVTCAITALAGDGDVDAALTRIDAIFDAVENTLRSAPALAQTPPFVAAVADGALFMDVTAAGLEPRLVFTVTAQARI